MGSTIIDSDFPHELIKRGSRDARRHNYKVKEAARKQLKDIITSQDIITSSGNKKVKVRLKYLDSYHFRHYPDRTDVIGRDTYDELEDGEIISQPNSGDGGNGGIPMKPGNEEGDEIYEVDFTVDDLTELMIEELNLPDLDDRVKSEIVSPIIEWTDRRKNSGVHALIDKKQTILANIQRRAKMRIDKGGKCPIINDDLRFRTWQVNEEKHSNAVVFLMMDRSGSMFEDKIYATKAFYFWVVAFLRRKYDRVEIKFISHDMAAREMEEKDFFTISDSGGTMVSSAYKMCADMINFNYPSSKWNIYCFHASDGDTWSDEAECANLVQQILGYGAKLFGYVEVFNGTPNSFSSQSSLWKALQDVASSDLTRLKLTAINDLNEVMDAINYFFGREKTEKKVAEF